MENEVLKELQNIKISYDNDTNILYCKWIGFQTKEEVMNGCEKILEEVKHKECSKVLNDNTDVTGPWQEATEWVARNWFPRMEEAGLKHFAWVFSENIFAELSAKSAKPDSEVVTTFNSPQAADTWLKKQ